MNGPIALNKFIACAAAFVIMGTVACSVAQEPFKPAATALVTTFPLEYQIIDPDNPKNAKLKPSEKKLPPMIVMFPGGKTADDADATGPIGRLESFRGKSKLIPESNDDKGLPVFLSGLRFLERRDANGKLEGYDVELQGEFNAVKVHAPETAMQDFLAGKKATFSLEAKLNYAIIATVSTTKLEISRSGNKLFIHSVEGDFSLREGVYTYKSGSLKLMSPMDRNFLFEGQAGKLPDLRIL